MCNYKKLENNKYGYVVLCKGCNHIQVAFASTILSLTTDQFYELIDTVDCLYNQNCMHPFQDQKTIQIPTIARSVTMLFSVNELRRFLDLLIKGRNKLQYTQLFVFHEN